MSDSLRRSTRSSCLLISANTSDSLLLDRMIIVTHADIVAVADISSVQVGSSSRADTHVLPSSRASLNRPIDEGSTRSNGARLALRERIQHKHPEILDEYTRCHHQLVEWRGRGSAVPTCVARSTST